ncbi:uncharacterized protein FIBRA_07551 [Fibroporia radiculosa]|uniref:Uncharacterized protein n=1 Tax=Fibroporia radiculosa TaxID=599839 RepID=J4I0W0_9APHY|nr:uncharacterized protein FIBRA_07551 [Fibroporia radiculosa]CCM05337.1 predicted protein [Fibroporia radiculosa]
MPRGRWAAVRGCIVPYETGARWSGEASRCSWCSGTGGGDVGNICAMGIGGVVRLAAVQLKAGAMHAETQTSLSRHARMPVANVAEDAGARAA